jgi:hypothetical protein
VIFFWWKSQVKGNIISQKYELKFLFLNEQTSSCLISCILFSVFFPFQRIFIYIISLYPVAWCPGASADGIISAQIHPRFESLSVVDLEPKPSLYLLFYKVTVLARWFFSLWCLNPTQSAVLLSHVLSPSDFLSWIALTEKRNDIATSLDTGLLSWFISDSFMSLQLICVGRGRKRERERWRDKERERWLLLWLNVLIVCVLWITSFCW